MFACRWPLVFAVGLSGCANSSLGRPELLDERCPWAGRWTLTDVSCGSFGSFRDFYERFDGASLVASGTETGCAVQVALDGVACSATERWTVVLDETDEMRGDLESTGILACEPSGCSFDGSTPCLPGAGAGSSPVEIVASEDQLVLTGAFGAASEGIECPLGLVATFAATE